MQLLQLLACLQQACLNPAADSGNAEHAFSYALGLRLSASEPPVAEAALSG